MWRMNRAARCNETTGRGRGASYRAGRGRGARWIGLGVLGWFALAAAGAPALGQVTPSAPRPWPGEFAPGRWQRLEELPPGRFRSHLERLPPAARERAGQWLRSFHFTPQDLTSLAADREGGVYYVCRFERPPETNGAPAAAAPAAEGPGAAALPVSPFPAALIFHSRPGAPNVLYLNFAGENVTGTLWNTELGRSTIPARPFSVDGDDTTFNDTEQAIIRRILQRVAEDYAPFDVDVTTERPASFTSRTGMALITRRLDANGAPNPAHDAGGIAYVNVFGTLLYAKYRPAWIYHDNLGNVEANLAEAVAHELGHNLGLSHDGKTDGTEYYTGHGSGDLSWAPIMGAGYQRNVTQWSQGEYYQANNTQDDLAILAGKLTYRADDHGNTPATATPVVLTGRTNIVSTTPETDPTNTQPANKGVLERPGDADWFSLVTGPGPIRLEVTPWLMATGPRGGNLDLLLELYDAGGTLWLTHNPPTTTTAVLATNLPAGLYYLAVRNTGAGDPFAPAPSGYTVYGSLGQYFLSGWVSDPAGVSTPPAAELAGADLTLPGQAEHRLTVVYSDNVAVDVATLDDADLRVTGPNGYDQRARFVAVEVPFNGTPRRATYSLPPPDGAVWSAAHNGTYTVWLEPQQVADTEGAWAPAGRLGEFRVAVPLVFYAASMDKDPGWTLDPLWQYGEPAYAAGGPTGGATGRRIIGYNLSGNYENSLSPRYATTPPLNTRGSTALSIRFQRWLRLRPNDTASLEVSTNGVQWLRVWSTTSRVQDTGWRQVQYPLPASVVGSATLQLRWGLASNAGQSDLGWHLDDVELLGEGTLDTRPPAAELSVATLTQAGSPNHLCTVRYTDDTAVRLASLDSADLRVSGPNGYAAPAEFLGADAPLDTAAVVATYAIPAPNGGWQAAHNGTYTVTLQEAEVEDIFGNATPGAELGTFAVNIPDTPPAVLDVRPDDPWVVSGPPGGPFAPAETRFTLTCVGSSGLRWSVTRTAEWLRTEPAEGALAAGESLTVHVTLDAALAAALPEGEYHETLGFLNTTSGLGNASREVRLTVAPPERVRLTVQVNEPAWGRVEPAGEETYPVGSRVELRAAPETWFVFRRWTGDVSSEANPLTLELTGDLTVLAEFAELVTTNHPTPLWWLAAQGVTEDFETAVARLGDNGLPLWQSYLAGLDPADPQSRPVLRLAPGPAPDTVTLAWATAPGRLYTLEQAPAPEGPFAPRADAVDLPGTGTELQHVAAVQPAPTFFRLSIRKP